MEAGAGVDLVYGKRKGVFGIDKSQGLQVGAKRGLWEQAKAAAIPIDGRQIMYTILPSRSNTCRPKVPNRPTGSTGYQSRILILSTTRGSQIPRPWFRFLICWSKCNRDCLASFLQNECKCLLWPDRVDPSGRQRGTDVDPNPKRYQ